MLDPDLVLAAVVEAFQSIPDLVDEMGGDPNNISGHEFAYGKEKSLAQHLAEMRSPSILVAYLDFLGGNWNGMTVWKHRLEAYVRPKNAAMGNVSGGAVAAGVPHLFWLMMNRPVNGGSQNIRYTELIPGLMMADAMPSLTHQQDGADLSDFFVCRMTFPELGDA